MVILWDFMVVLWCEYDDYGGDCVVFYGISQWDCMERKRAKKNDIVMVFIVRVCRSGFHGISWDFR